MDYFRIHWSTRPPFARPAFVLVALPTTATTFLEFASATAGTRGVASDFLRRPASCRRHRRKVLLTRLSFLHRTVAPDLRGEGLETRQRVCVEPLPAFAQRAQLTRIATAVSQAVLGAVAGAQRTNSQAAQAGCHCVLRLPKAS